MASGSFTDRPSVRGIGVGAGVWILGYAVTYGLVATTFQQSSLGRTARFLIDWQVAGWAYFGAHFVPVTGGVGGNLNVVSNAGGAALILYVLPVVTLVGAGAYLQTGIGATGLRSAVNAGTYVTYGYLLVTIPAIFLFQLDLGLTTIGPNPLLGLVLAGMVYPLVLGGVGGGVGYLLG